MPPPQPISETYSTRLEVLFAVRLYVYASFMRCYKMLQYVTRLCRRLEQSRWVLHPVILAPGTPEMLGSVESMGTSMSPWLCSALQCLALWIPVVSILQATSGVYQLKRLEVAIVIRGLRPHKESYSSFRLFLNLSDMLITCTKL